MKSSPHTIVSRFFHIAENIKNLNNPSFRNENEDLERSEVLHRLLESVLNKLLFI